MSEYDGIQERQKGKSKMPVGMTVLFIGLIVFGLIYMYLFSPQTTGWNQSGQYQKRMEALKSSVITHETKEVESGMSEGSGAEDGAAIYKAECAMCHGEKLEGGIGPALTGPTFIYGGTLADHIRVISDGTPKGMPAFAKQLGPDKVRAVAHYIHFRHTK
ncbi:MAG: cytochrome c [Betaproteobacteria bacterium]